MPYVGGSFVRGERWHVFRSRHRVFDAIAQTMPLKPVLVQAIEAFVRCDLKVAYSLMGEAIPE